MNAKISKPFADGCRMSNEPIQRGFLVRPTSLRLSTSGMFSPRKNSVRNKHLRRLSTGHDEHQMMSSKYKPIFIFDKDIVLAKKNDPHSIQRSARANTVNLNADDFIKEKPKRKQNRGLTPSTKAGIIVSSIYDADDETAVLSSDGSSIDSCDSSSRNSFSAPSTQQRKVRFPLDSNGRVQCQEYYMSEEDAAMLRQCRKRDLWWTKKDRLTSRDMARERMQLELELFPTYQAATIQLLTKFGGIDTSSSDTVLPPKLLSRYTTKPRSDSYAVHTIAQGSDIYRGFEKMLYRVIGTGPPKYRNAVKQVIAAQQELKALYCCSPDLVMTVLSTQYIHDTHGAVAMARLRAESDIIAAQDSVSTMLLI